MNNLPEYEAILERAKQLWPQQSDLKHRSRREDAMLEIMSALFDSFGNAVVAHVAEHGVAPRLVAALVRLLSVGMRLHSAVVANGGTKYNTELLKESEKLFNEIENWDG